MKNFLKKYLFIFEFIGAAILLVVGLVGVFQQSFFLYLAGAALIIFGFFRVIPLVKTTKDNLMKFIYIFEILLNLAAGVLLILEGSKGDDANLDLLKYFIGAVLYLRGFLYFFATVMRKESTDYVKFFTHIAIFTLAVAVLIGDFLSVGVLAWIFLVVAVVSGGFIGFSGYGHYRKYRYEQAAKDETGKYKDKEKGLELPAEEEDSVEKEIIIPEEEKQDELHV